MKVVTLIPYWRSYSYGNKDLSDRDSLRLSDRILMDFPILLSNGTSLIDETYLYTNDLRISSEIDSKLKYKLVNRDRKLDRQGVSIEAIIGSFLAHNDAEVVVLLHPNAPLIQRDSLERCINQVINGNKFDSAFIATEEKRFAWFNGKRLNYATTQGTPHIADLSPIVLETTAVYVFTRKCFEETQTRIGTKPYIHVVSSFEGSIIESKNDLRLIEFLIDVQYNFYGDLDA